jgi:hypothetical protein
MKTFPAMLAAIGLIFTSIAISVVLPAFALNHYQIGYNDGCAGITVPGSHTRAYLQGYSVGAQACHQHPAQQQSHSLPTSPSTGFPCVGGSGKNYCTGYHAGAVAADNDDSAGRGVGFHGCPAGHIAQYCQGYERGYNDEAGDLA